MGPRRPDLERLGSLFTGYSSETGDVGSWVWLGQFDWGLDAPETVQLGLALGFGFELGLELLSEDIGLVELVSSFNSIYFGANLHVTIEHGHRG